MPCGIRWQITSRTMLTLPRQKHTVAMLQALPREDRTLKPEALPRRRRSGPIGALAAAILIVGCNAAATSPSPAATGTPSSATPAAEESASQSGGSLTVAIQEDVRSTSSLERNTVDNLVWGSTVFDALFVTDDEGAAIPALATGAESSDDFLEWTFPLREGVTFSNGNPFSAESVKLAINAWLDPQNASSWVQDLSNVESYDVIDDHTIHFVLKAPDSYFPHVFKDVLFIQDWTTFDPEHPIGTGPYVFDHRVIGDQVVFKRNPTYWRGTPPLDEVIMKVLTDPLAATLAMQKGELDLWPQFLDDAAIATLGADPNVTLYSTPGTTTYQAYLNFEKDRRGGYKDGQAIRQGLAYLLNVQELVPPIIGDFGTAATQQIPPSVFGHDPDLTFWPYDPAQGQQLLTQGGIEPGGEITLMSLDRPGLCSVGTAFQAVLVSLGYKATFQCLKNEIAADVVQTYAWDLFFWRNGQSNLAVGVYANLFSVANAPDPPDDIFTLRDEEIQGVIDEMRATTDPTKYERLAHEAAQIITKERIAVVPLYWPTTYIAARNNVHGVVVSSQSALGILMNEMTTVSKSGS